MKTSRGIFHSKTVKKYLQKLGVNKFSVSKKTVEDYKTRPNKFRELEPLFKEAIGEKQLPLKVGFHFVRGTRHKCDFHNAVQIIADLMVAHNFIEDDNMDCFLPFPFKMKGKFYTHNAEEPGVFIKIL
ncbi:MAG: hypothetical protein KUG81_08685 [Gammaproteobacteria bacterium]|nr:hypothetical protein [Gammaproteobacteria bacterium]